MEVSDEVFDSILTPTAAYIAATEHTANNTVDSWDTSLVNPRNKIDSTELPGVSVWRFDGVDPSGSRYFIIPEFAVGMPPRRIDVLLPKHGFHSKNIRRELHSNLSVLPHERDTSHHDMIRFLLRTLTLWSLKDPKFRERYLGIPFGSRVIVENLALSSHETVIHLVPIYHVEKQWASLHVLRKQWALPEDAWPPTVSIEDLALLHQPHEAISLINIPRLEGKKVFVFKSLVRDLKYLYHELQMLLESHSHPHILGKPAYIVTKRAQFGSKVGVCGFVMQYYPEGNLCELIGAQKASVTLSDRFRWARQITSALVHIKGTVLGYYPDLKPDNIIIYEAEGTRNALLIDLEQRGGWYSWSPPEVFYVEFIEYLACSDMVDQPISDRHAKLMRAWFPGWQPPTRLVKYEPIPQGYSTAWSQMGDNDREAAQVFMLGKMLWCIFESQPSINCGMSPDILRERGRDREFPDYINTPGPVQDLIRRCTLGADEWKGNRRPVERRGHLLVLRKREVNSTPENVKEEATKWWQQEIANAVRYMERLAMERQGVLHPENAAVLRGRPSLEDVYSELCELSKV